MMTAPDMIEIAGDVVRTDRRTLWFRPTYPRGSEAVPLPRKWCFPDPEDGVVEMPLFLAAREGLL